MPSPVMGPATVSGGDAGSAVIAVLCGGHQTGTGPGAAATHYVTFGNLGTNGVNFLASEAARQILSPVPGDLTSLCVRTTGAQPGDGDLVLTVRVNGAATGITITIPAGQAAGIFSDTTHTAPVVAGDLISLEAANASPTGGATFAQWSIAIQA